MRAQFKLDGSTVVAAFDCPLTGDRETHRYHIPHQGGYVREGAGGAQVCELLSNRGVTLIASSPTHLLAVIRREYRRLVAANRKERESW